MKQNKPKPVPPAEEAAVRAGKRNEWIIKLLCVCCAFILWLYVMEVESPEYTEEINFIEVELLGTDVLESVSGLSVYSGQENFINITVSGRRSVISKLNTDDIVATVDVSNITEAGRHPLEIRIDLPGGLALMSKSQDSITVYADETTSKTIPVDENILNMDLPDNYEIGTIGFEYDSITVTGPKIVVNNIGGARVDIDLSDKTSSFIYKGPIYLVDNNNNVLNNPYLKYTIREVTVEVPIYTSVTVPVEVAFKYGFLNESNAKITVTPSSVTIKGDESAMAAETLLTPIILDEKKITGNSYGRTLTLQSAANTTIVGSSEVQINVEIDPSITSLEMNVTDIQVTGADGIAYEILEEMLTVTLQGPLEKLSRIRPSDVYAELDLSGFSSKSSGTVTKTAKIVVDAEDTEGIYEVGEYTVQVKIN